MPRNATTDWSNAQVLSIRLTPTRRTLLEQAMDRRGLEHTKRNATACIEWDVAQMNAQDRISEEQKINELEMWGPGGRPEGKRWM